MFIDFLTLVIINLVAGLVILAWYLFKGIDLEDQKPWSAAFMGVGLLAFITGLYISFTWPLPGAYNIAFGDADTLFGLVFMVAAVGLWKGWSLFPASLLGAFAGFDALVFGLRIINLQITSSPLLCGLGFIVAGLAGIFSVPFMLWFKKNKVVRVIAIGVLLVGAAIWLITFTGATWAHMETFAKYVPALMK
jgi:putative membrane protein